MVLGRVINAAICLTLDDLTIKNRKMIIGIISHFSSAAKYARPNLICLSNVISFFYQEYYISSYDVC